MIEMDGVCKRYRKEDYVVDALDDVSLSIDHGEFVAIRGPSGSGKSTLLNVLGTLDRPDRGSYRLNGRDVSTFSADELAALRNRKIGFVFQSFHLLPRTTAIENVELPLIYSDRSDISDLARRALARVGLADRASHEPGELSGGQQQRVAIARALVNDPDLILADEPSGNLDSRSGLEILATLQDLNVEGVTVVLVTHDAELARMASRRVEIVDGRIRSDEPVTDRRDAVAALAAVAEA
ncbi:MAG: ABC transporter ATP-binding protein [Gemmatimonadetes bacterium]|uniref:ABC transporter ATP-binding protein n=1 Tax=Candidatus Kutchimonas denitrificans TaxID=3056748 RepID=A0AAE4Z9Q4_9BACT|nr:ABC transporter ATP-binding protein [Gemmatimonadota bacterium]NIR74096.1 ABC transporter ATP-binding protein [Candidatus Kutchimonas denitrificans]NIS01658.1 ABC transporter ATP-binding protein [Gemmatimonadota bacterium]NIT67396.1 ABC transporter ATP-binding protein [Gemmatimonadota bacterium]NIU52759.1 ATP-binding cassette domain-containing protein [Gemmatimonadota bacterium]